MQSPIMWPCRRGETGVPGRSSTFAMSRHVPRLLLLASVLWSISSAAVVDVFTAGDEAGVKQFRIPALIRTDKGTLLAFAEARTDPATDCAYKWIAARRSTDNGTTWSASIPIGGFKDETVATGNPQAVFHAPSGKIIVMYSAKNLPKGLGLICNPGDAMYVVDDGGSDGARWGTPVNITSQLGQWGAALPGPGAGVVLTHTHPGRIVFSATLLPYGHDIASFSDDGGATWTPSGTPLPEMDESCPTELPNGTLYLSMRNPHSNPCDCQAYATSDDGGATWSLPIQYDPVLVSPVCEGSVATSTNGRLYFANPDSKVHRQDTTIRRTHVNSMTWETKTLLVAPGSTFGGYTSLVVEPPVIDGSGATWGGILFERNTSSAAVISFTLFPLEF